MTHSESHSEVNIWLRSAFLFAWNLARDSSTLRLGKERVQEKRGDAVQSDQKTLTRSLWALLFLSFFVNSSAALAGQAKTDKEANLSDQEKIQRILNRVIQQDREKPVDTDAKANRTMRAADRIAQMNNRLEANRQLQTAQSRSFSGVIRDVDRGAITAGNDITYPKDWKERTKNRVAPGSQMTAKERSILSTLDSSITLDVKNRPFESVIDYLRAKTGLPILIDRSSLSELDVSYDSPVTLSVKDVSLRTVLHKMLADLGLTYIIRNENVMIVSPGVAKQSMVIRTYYAQDLVPSGWGFITALQAAQLIELIQSTVAPQSWKGNGGDGTMVYDPITGGIVVKQSAEFQSVLANAGR